MIAPHRQRGVALITALMIVALATVVSASITTRLQLDVRRTGNIIASDQAALYATAAEALAGRYLMEDLKDNKIDHWDEEWATEYIFPLEGGTLKAQLSDFQSCINLNSLLKGATQNPVATARFENLLRQHNLPTTLWQAIVDWLDSNADTTIPDGAEDGHYTTLATPYRSANNFLRSISELKLIRGFEDQQTIDAIRRTDDPQGEVICAFGDGTIPINVNTAPTEVLLSLSNNMTEQMAADIIAERATNPFTDISNFMSFNNLETIITQQQDLSVNTSYFMLETDIEIGQARVKTFSLLHRPVNTSGTVSVVSRSQSVY